MGSPDSPLSPTCPISPIEPACEALEEDRAVPIPQAATRRKSSTWKGFNLKRRLSKVDLKLKNTFGTGDQALKGKRHSVFYSGVSPSEDMVDLDEDITPESDENTIVDNHDVVDILDDLKELDIEELSSPSESILEDDAADLLVGSLGTQYELHKKVNFQRPDNLELVDDDGYPVRPPRQKKRFPDKRDQRLLSVPNIKFQKPEMQLMRDLRDKDENSAAAQPPTFAGNLMRRFNKLDSSFSRSRSSSMSSLENISSEAIQCLVFADSYTRRSDPTFLTPTLWVGTSLGSVLTILITPPDQDSRSSQPVVCSLVGVTIFRLKGAILTMSFLDCNGSLIPYSFESWRDDNKDRRDSKLGTPTKSANRMSPTLGENNRDYGDRQYVVICSEKQARVVGLPSQTCIYRQQIADTDFVVKAETVSIKDSVCLVCYVSNGHLQAYSLPSLRPLIDIDFLPLSELSFQTQSNKGIVDPMLSIWGQQLIVNEDTNHSNLTEMMGELFLPLDMPEPPKEGFIKSLFGGGVRSLDREELFGESSGKASKHVAKHIPGTLQELNSRVTSSTCEVSRAHKLMIERGEKLGRLEDNAERMKNEAENFSSGAHELMLKYKDKKWYQL